MRPRSAADIVGRTRRSALEILVSINHLFVSDQWSISKNIEIIKRRNKSNSIQYSLENSIAKKRHTQKACGHIHLNS